MQTLITGSGSEQTSYPAGRICASVRRRCPVRRTTGHSAGEITDARPRLRQPGWRLGTRRYDRPMDRDLARPTASIVVPAYQAAPHLARCVDSLCAQELQGDFEVIVVVSGNDGDDLSYAEAISHRSNVSVILHRPRLTAAGARNVGVERARSDLLVFTDADVIVEADWLGNLVEAAAGTRCVAGAVINGTPSSRAGTTEYLVEFLDFHPGRPPNTIWHGATCNLAVPRGLWERFGPFLSASERVLEVDSADTAFTLEVAAQGLLTFCADARIRHMNRTRLRTVLAHQVSLGRNAAMLARSNATFPYRTLVQQTWAVPLIVAARWLSLWRRLAGWRVGLCPTALRLTGHIALALGAWGVGLFKENLAIQRGRA